MASKVATLSAQKTAAVLRPHKVRLVKLGRDWSKADESLDSARMALGLQAMQAKADLVSAGSDEDPARLAVLRAIGQDRLDWQSVRKWSNAGDVAAVLPEKVRDALTLESILPLAAIDSEKRAAFAASQVKAGNVSRAAMRKAVQATNGRKAPTAREKAAKLESKHADNGRVIRAKLGGTFGETDKERKTVLSAALFAARVIVGRDLEKFEGDAIATLLDWTTPDETDSDES